MSKISESEIVNILWTGGWDSTFRLLQIVLEEKKSAQPYYLIDPDRQSLRQEIKAMGAIKGKIMKDFPESKERILPTKFYEIMDLKPNETLTKAFEYFRKHKLLATQYLWFSWFCRQHDIHDMELCTEHKAVKPETDVFHSILKPNGSIGKYQITDEFLGSPVEYILKDFRFPIYGYTKRDIEVKAKELKWINIMDMTWFCHHPVHDWIPCGNCVPCKQTIEEGFARRIPFHRRLLGVLGYLKLKQIGGKLVRKAYPNFHA